MLKFLIKYNLIKKDLKIQIFKVMEDLMLNEISVNLSDL